MREIAVNRLLEYPADGLIERVLWIDPLNRGFYAIDIRAPRALPVFRRMEDTDEVRAAGDWRSADADPWMRPLPDEVISPTHRARRDKAWALIRLLVFEQPAIFQETPRGRAIRLVMGATGANKRTLYRLLRRYWQRGLVPNALLPDYARCGGRGKDKAATAKKRGRSSATGIAGLNITPEIRSMFRTVITRRFATNQKMNMRDAHEEVIRTYFSDQAVDERTGHQVLVTRDNVPSLRQFRYWFERDNDSFKVRARRTPRVYDKDMRALLGSSTAETVGPGSRYQIDATIADVYLLSRYDRTKIVGKPVLYIIIDVFSRMITGIYVGLEGPSWVGAMMALANAASDKVEFCKGFGIEIGEADWPCQGLPDILLGDRGELASSHIETVINQFGVHVENTAPYRPDWKGVVEQRFRLLPSCFKAYTPGFVEGDFKARGSSDYRLDAVLDIDQFTSIILHCILYYNTRHLIHNYEKTPQMIADGVDAVPVELWDWGISRLSGTQRRFPPELVRLSLLPADDATVTESGIRYKGCFYSCQKAIEEHWMERARQRGTYKVRISYEPRCMDEIYLHGQTGGLGFITCALTDKSRHDQGKTLWEIDQIHKDEARRRDRYEPRDLQGRVNMTSSIKEIIAKGQAMRPGHNGKSKSGLTNMRENRGAERRALQERDAFRAPERKGDEKAVRGEVSPFPGVKPKDEYSLPDITEISRRFGKGTDDDGVKE